MYAEEETDICTHTHIYIYIYITRFYQKLLILGIDIAQSHIPDDRPAHTGGGPLI